MIDLRTEKPKYCFFAIDGFEGESNEGVKNMTPYSVKEYLTIYGCSKEAIKKLNGKIKAEVMNQKELNSVLSLQPRAEKAEVMEQ